MTAQIVHLASFRASRRQAPGLLQTKEHRPGGKDMSTLITRHEHRWADHRDQPRHRLGGVRRMSLRLGGEVAGLENVSRNGLMARADLPQDPGARVTISINGCEDLTGLLVWKRDGLVGLNAPIGSLKLA